MTQFAVEIADVFKSYRRGTSSTPVLQNLSLNVEHGQCVFLAGPSGSGKTTLLSIIGCILSQDEGTVNVLAEDFRNLSAKEKAAFRLKHIGFVFQRFHLIRGLTALENVCVPLSLAGVKAPIARERGLALLSALGIHDKALEHPATLSTGQCQRVALARALASDTDLILADEPTASLDAENGQQVMQLFRELTKEQGKTAIVVTHDSRIFQFSDQIHWLEDGQIKQSCKPSEFATGVATSADHQMAFPTLSVMTPTNSMPPIAGNR